MQRDRRPTAALQTPERVFGRVLQAIRRERGFSQEKLGFESGYHPTYISRLERGVKNPSLQTILSLASVLGISGSELLRQVEPHLGKRWKRPQR